MEKESKKDIKVEEIILSIRFSSFVENPLVKQSKND